MIISYPGKYQRTYNFEHNYGHGEQNLSVVFATLMMLQQFPLSLQAQ
jgi:hypothetical protein